MKKIFGWIKKRAKEPSTWTGLAAIATVAGLPGVAGVIGQAGTMAVMVLGGGLIATQKPDPMGY